MYVQRAISSRLLHHLDGTEATENPEITICGAATLGNFSRRAGFHQTGAVQLCIEHARQPQATITYGVCLVPKASRDARPERIAKILLREECQHTAHPATRRQKSLTNRATRPHPEASRSQGGEEEHKVDDPGSAGQRSSAMKISSETVVTTAEHT